MTRRMFIFFFFSVFVSASPPDPRATITACKLVQNERQSEGSIVAVRGVLHASLDVSGQPYFDELVAEECPGEKESIVRIKIVSPDSHFLTDPPKGYKPDLKSIQRSERVLSELLKRSNARRVAATVEGVFYGSASVEQLTKTDRMRPHRQYRGYIVLQAIKEIGPRK